MPSRTKLPGIPPAPDPIQKFKSILSKVQYKDWDFYVGSCEGERPYLQIRFYEMDSYTNLPEPQHGRKYFLSPWMTKSEVVATAFQAILAAEFHECREFFKYEGHPIYSPHFSVDALVDLCRNNQFDARDIPPKKSTKTYNFPFFNQMGGEHE